MSGDFLDSSVLLYLFAEPDEPRRRIAMDVVADALAADDSAISFQVVQEVLNGIVRRANPPASQEDTLLFLRETIARLWRVMPSQRLYEEALRIHARYQFNLYDSLIVAAALEAGSRRLLTEDLQDGQRIEGLLIENPFRA